MLKILLSGLLGTSKPAKVVDLKLETIPAVIYVSFLLYDFCYVRHYANIIEEQVKVRLELMRKNKDSCRNLPDLLFLLCGT